MLLMVEVRARLGRQTADVMRSIMVSILRGNLDRGKCWLCKWNLSGTRLIGSEMWHHMCVLLSEAVVKLSWDMLLVNYEESREQRRVRECPWTVLDKHINVPPH